MGLFSKSSSSSITEDMVRTALSTINDPDLKRDIVSLGFLKSIAIDGDKVAVSIQLTTPACPVKDEMKAQAEQALRDIGATDVQVEMTANVTVGPAQRANAMLPGVRNTIAVASGKGGVGKS